MKQLYAIMVWMLLLTGGFSSWAHEVTSDSLILLSDSSESDTLNLDPEWYVAPVIPASLRAPMRAHAATSCSRVEAIQSFNIDSVLVEGTYYEYDAKGNVISTTVWAYAPDGTMTGKSKNEYAFDATGTQTMTAVYVWEDAANDWKGTEKYEYVYKTFTGEKKMISNTSLVWLNGAWVADQRFTYDYDASLREISYFEYRRNTSTNELQPVKGREQSWTDDLQTLEVLYTAYANGKWTAGTKKEWIFNENGVQTLLATYTMSNGTWVGSSKETWAYNTSSKLTLHEKYGWAGNDWSITLQENTTYDASGNTTLIENYSWSNGIKTGTKKEQYSFDGGKPVLTMVYAWSNGAWIGSSKEVWNYNASSKLTLHEKYGWTNNDWSLTLQEKTVYSGANITLIENYTWSNGVKTGTKKEEYAYSGSLKTSFVTYSWAGSDWVGASKEIWAYTSGKQTLHEQFIGEGANWSKTLREENEYSGANLIRVENYSYANGVTTGTKKETYAYSGSDKEAIVYAWANTAWIESTKEVWGYTSGMQTLHEQYVWNDAWVGVSKETWTYTSSKLTRHETYAWGSSDWSILTQENTAYSGANIIRIENYEWVNGVKTGTQKEEYTYTSGEKTMTVVYAWANDEWVYSTKNEAGYRDGNVEVSATNYAWNGSAWVGIGTRTQTTYDGSKIIEKLTKNWPSGATDWTNAAITTNTYNADGANIMTYNGTWNGSRWVMSSMTRTDIIKDDQGRQLLRASWKCSSDSVWKGVAKDTAAYTESGKTLYIAQYASWLNNNWVPSYRVEYQYDDMERVILNQRYDWKSNKWQGKYKYEYSYDDQGRQTMSASYKSWNTSKNNWVGSSKSEIVYDANGRIEKETSYKWSNNNWVYLFNNIYQYDAQGKEILHIVQSRGSNGEWMNSEKYEKEYRGNTLVKDYVYVWMNEEWQIYSLEQLLYDNDIQAKLRHEIKGLWNISGAVQSYTDKLYSYNCDPHFYTVRFVNYDGQVLANMTAQEGETPVYPGSTPTKPADTENTYTFSGWTPALAPVTANITYTATFTATKNTYTITWKNEDGTVLQSGEVAYGEAPVYIGEMPSRPSTAEYTYTFAGWTPGIGIVTSDAEYIATYDSVRNSYTITWLNSDNSLLSSTTVEYGEAPVYTGEMPSRPNTAEYTYTFAGWSPEIVSVAGDAKYTALFDSIKNSYTITWKNEDGSVIQSETLEYGSTPAHANIYKENTAEWSYTFTGWTPQIVPVTGDAEYTATFTATKNTYTITWKNEDGIVLQSGEVAYGEAPVYIGEMPSRPNTAENTYTFSGWDKEVVTVTEAATYTATYTATKNTYTITWKNEDGTVLQSGEVAYGEAPVYTGEMPSRPSTAEYTYTFTGWSPEIVPVAGDAEYTALFDSIKNTYTITWKDEDGTVLKSEEIEYGVMPTAPSDPTKASTAEYTYTFAGWDKEVVTVTEAATYTATYTATERLENKTFTITFYYEEGGIVVDRVVVAYGETPSTNRIPSMPSDERYYYTFSGWNPEIVPANSDADYVATFTAIPKEYRVTFKNYNGRELQSILVPYGEMPEYTGEIPARPSNKLYTYTFIGWTPEITEVTGNATYTALFETVSRTQDVEEVQSDQVPCTKVLIDGQIYILRGGNIYTIDGQRVQ